MHNPMTVREFGRNYTGPLAEVFESGQEREITWQGRDYVTIVPTGLWRQADQCRRESHTTQDVVDGLLRLAERGATAGEFQAYAEALGQLSRSRAPGDVKNTEGVSTMV